MQILPQQIMGYDRAISVFSPEGRLLQVEYAKKAVQIGAMTMGVTFKDGVLLIADRRITEKLIVPESVKKTSKIDEHIAASFAGFTADARILVKRCRIYAQQHRLTYGEEIDVEGIARFICDIAQTFTQYAGIRPLGVSFLLGGVDKKGIQLFVTEPSAIYSRYLAKAIGAGSGRADRILERKYREGLSKEEALRLAISIFKEVLEKEFSYARLEAVTITKKGVEEVEFKK